MGCLGGDTEWRVGAANGWQMGALPTTENWGEEATCLAADPSGEYGLAPTPRTALLATNGFILVPGLTRTTGRRCALLLSRTGERLLRVTPNAVETLSGGSLQLLALPPDVGVSERVRRMLLEDLVWYVQRCLDASGWGPLADETALMGGTPLSIRCL